MMEICISCVSSSIFMVVELKGMKRAGYVARKEMTRNVRNQKENAKGKDELRDQGVDKRTILK
jgi:hypothetical protein